MLLLPHLYMFLGDMECMAGRIQGNPCTNIGNKRCSAKTDHSHLLYYNIRVHRLKQMDEMVLNSEFMLRYYYTKEWMQVLVGSRGIENGWKQIWSCFRFKSKFITARVRSTMEGNVVTLFVSSLVGGGGQDQGRVTPCHQSVTPGRTRTRYSSIPTVGLPCPGPRYGQPPH